MGDFSSWMLLGLAARVPRLLAAGAAGAAGALLGGSAQLEQDADARFKGMGEAEVAQIRMVEQVSPSVLSVSNNAAVRRGLRARRADEVPQGAGSGFVYDSVGHVVTNAHVVTGASSISVTLSDGTSRACSVVGADPANDIAVLRLDSPAELQLSPIALGRSGALMVGQRAYAMGSPFGLDHTLTVGVVSALGRECVGFGGRTIRDVIQTDAALNPGSSGGPLLNSAGQCIGMSTMIVSPTGANSGVGFAIPIDTVRRVVDAIITTGHAPRPGLGIALAHDSVLRRMRIGGALVERAPPSTGLRGTTHAADGSILLGDIITRIGKEDVQGAADVLRALDRVEVGDVVSVTYLRPTGRQRGGRLEVAEKAVAITVSDLAADDRARAKL